MDNTHTTRIVDHVRVRAGDIVPHELNPRTHTDAQKSALAALLKEIGFARSLLAYRLPDGRLKLIDGHLRQSMDPDATVDVEVLDVNDAEARALLLAIDPLAQLAGYDADTPPSSGRSPKRTLPRLPTSGTPSPNRSKPPRRA